MAIQILKENDGTIQGFIVGDVAFDIFCWMLAQNPDVAFPQRRRFFFWSDNLKNDFTFRGQPMHIAPDAWDGAITVKCVPVEDLDCLITDLIGFVEKGKSLLRQSPLTRCTVLARCVFLGILVLFPLIGLDILSHKGKMGVVLIWILMVFCLFIVLVLHFLHLNKIRAVLRSHD